MQCRPDPVHTERHELLPKSLWPSQDPVRRPSSLATPVWTALVARVECRTAMIRAQVLLTSCPFQICLLILVAEVPWTGILVLRSCAV